MPDERWSDLVDGAVGGAVSQGTMFGSRGLRTGRKFFALWWHEQLVAKLPADRGRQLVDAGDAEQFEPMEGRPMNGWFLVHPRADWPGVVAQAQAHVEAQLRP